MQILKDYSPSLVFCTFILFICYLIDNYLMSGKGVLIHCHAGMQRAATVTACYLMSGRNDYLLQVFAASLKHYETFVRRKLTHIAGIGALETNFAFGQVKRASVLPSHGLLWGSK